MWLNAGSNSVPDLFVARVGSYFFGLDIVGFFGILIGLQIAYFFICIKNLIGFGFYSGLEAGSSWQLTWKNFYIRIAFPNRPSS
jgi:hypothetical protein